MFVFTVYSNARDNVEQTMGTAATVWWPPRCLRELLPSRSCYNRKALRRIESTSKWWQRAILSVCVSLTRWILIELAEPNDIYVYVYVYVYVCVYIRVDTWIADFHSNVYVCTRSLEMEIGKESIHLAKFSNNKVH